MPAPGLGRVLAEGRTSKVVAYGADSVVKIPRAGIPPHWPCVEATVAEAVHRAGLPCPEVRGLVEVGGRTSIVFERIDGPSLWRLILERPREVDRFAALLVGIQGSIHRVGSLPSVPRMDDRLRSKIVAAEGLTEDQRRSAGDLMASLPSGAALCHGDLHPGNILMAGGRPVVIDWFDAAIGAPGADVVRTSLLTRPPLRSRSAPTHLPDANPELLDALHRSYLRHALRRLESAPAAELSRWERVLAAARLAERTTSDRADLLALWRSEGGAVSVLAGILGAVSAAGDDGLEPIVDPRRGDEDQVAERDRGLPARQDGGAAVR